MNVQNVPFLHDRYGGEIVLGFMTVLGLGMFMLFRKKDWL
jgi:magnesium transporter